MRLFFALWPSPSTAEQLAARARVCVEQFGGRPTREETIHLTLAFLGEVPEEQLPQLVKCAQEIRQSQFDLTIDHVACWKHNHLLWAGCTSTPPALKVLSESLQQALREIAFAGERDKHGFTPHVTLVRKLPVAGATAFLATHARLEIEPILWRCSSFVLVCSLTTASGPQYQVLYEFPLAAK